VDVEPRALTQRERDVVDELLRRSEVAIPAAAIDALQVVGRCDCGCPTIYFNDGANGPLIASAYIDGTYDEVLLFASEDDEYGPLSSLELAWIADTPPSELPPISRLHAPERA
jgi:hypothetical protein